MHIVDKVSSTEISHCSFTYATQSELEAILTVLEIWMCSWSQINLVIPQKAMKDNKYYSPDCLPALRQLVTLVFLITGTFRSKAGIKKSRELAESKFDSRWQCRGVRRDRISDTYKKGTKFICSGCND